MRVVDERLCSTGPNLRGFMADWEQSAQRAMQAEPLYFARWYTVKSIALVGVTAALVYVLVRKK